MALQTIPGQTGYVYARMNFMDKRVVGKLTDSNKLASLAAEKPQAYDKEIISLYSQTSLYSNDFLNMINKSEPFLLGNANAWSWDLEVPYKYPKIIEVPSDTLNDTRVGIDGHEFTLVFDRQEWTQHYIIGSDPMHAPQFYVVKDPTPYNSGFLYTLTLNSDNPRTEFVDKKWLAVGIEYMDFGGATGEFDQTLMGLPGFADKIKMYETLGSAIGFEHTVTGWAEDKNLGLSPTYDGAGRPLDVMIYAKGRRNELPTSSNMKWEPFIEFWMRTKMLEAKVKKMIWAKPGAPKTRGAKQEVKKVSAGLYHRIRTNGNYMPFQTGDFKLSILRAVFGQIFYRKVPMGQRRVRIYTNERGFDLFDQAAKNEAFSSGLQFQVADGDRFIQGSGQNMILNFGFSGYYTRETGKIELIHMTELDQPNVNTTYGPYMKSPAIFFVFDIDPAGDGTFGSNVREVRLEGRPPMKWGYIDGRTSHKGSKASVGMQSSTMADQYTVWMEDRYDVFIEDTSRCAIIEEIPYQ